LQLNYEGEIMLTLNNCEVNRFQNILIVRKQT